MSAYMISLRTGPVKDPLAMADYQRLSREMGGNFKVIPRVIYGAIEELEGTPPEGVVMVEFPSMEEARAFYTSDIYQAVLPYRLKAADYQTFIVEGLGP